MTELPKTLIDAFMNAAVRDPAAADAMLAIHPSLLDARCLHDETVLHFLAIEGFGEGVRFLAARGANVNAVNRFGDPPLIDVVKLGFESIAATLLEHGANPNATSVIEGNLLHAAITRGHDGIVRLLLQSGANWKYVTEDGDSLWDSVAESLDPGDIIAALAEFGIARGEE
jgi:ankyrin repeat protein